MIGGVSSPASPSTAGASADLEPGRDYRFEIVIVAYKSRDLIERFLSRMPDDLPVVVVDNSHDVDGLSELAATRSGTRFVDGPGRGYAAGANRGVAAATRPVVVLVDPDCTPTVAQIDELVAELDRDPDLALVSVTTLTPDGTVEIGVGGWEPTARRAFVHSVGLHKLFPDEGLWATPVPGVPIELDWLGGACMATPREVFQRLGGFDESYFVYNEDVEFSRRIRESGMRLAVRTDILVPHLSTGSGDPRPRMLQMRGASMMKYLRRHNSRRHANAIGAALTAGYAGRYLLCRATGRAGRAEEHAAYITGLWRGAPDMT
jgi:N-acetylglucosaminyl-diphospho-decaprenol L-rhamnosyltransferase